MTATPHDPVEDLAGATRARFELALRRLADALDPGLDPARLLGAGIDYVQSRPWAEGDDARSIDHKVSARAGRLYIKEYESLRGTPVLLVVDGSHSMRHGPVRPSKFAASCAIAAGLATAGLRRASAVGLAVLANPPLRLAPTRARGALLAALRRMPRLMPAAAEAEAGLSGFLRQIAAPLANRHLLVVLSDLQGANVETALRRLHQNHDLVVIRPIDPGELAPPRGGIVLAAEAETGRAGLRRGLPALSVQGPLQSLRGAGIDACGLTLDQAWLPRLVQFLRQRGSAVKAVR